ncbi:hypothetical protein HYI43_09665 [Staphylococcus taiwanensis]|nr:hypothetical protein HYI43_09665 [Staphylococcus taiwanensis]
MKKVLFIFLLSMLVVAGCSHTDSNNDNKDKKSNTHASSKQKDKDTSKEKDSKDEKSEDNNSNDKDSKDQNKSDENSNESDNHKNTVNNQSAKDNSQIDVNNITDRATLASIINSNQYSEGDKVAAYNSAVANGVIPQGNVMEGSASEAYASSLRVESGKEKSVYDQSQNNNNASSQSNEADPNAEINAATNEDDYVDALRKKYNGGLSSGEIQTKNAIEQGTYDGDDADEVYNTIQQREQDIANGKYDKYKQD